MKILDKYQTKKWLKIDLWLLLFIAISFGLLFSCSAPRGIKSGYRAKNQSNENKTEEITSINKALDNKEIINAEEETLETVIETNDIQIEKVANIIQSEEATTQRKSMPTLNQIMRKYEEEQSAIKADVEIMKDDIKDLKNSVDEVKRMVIAQKNGETEYAVASAVPEEKSNNVIQKEEPKNIILSDEVANIKQPKKTETVEKKKIPVKQQIKPQTIKPRAKKVEQKKEEAKQTNVQQINNTTNPSPATVVQTKPDLQAAISLVKGKNYNQAISNLNSLLVTEKDGQTIITCNYWLGEAHFGTKEWNKSLQYFQQVLNSKDSQYKDNAQAMIAEIHCRAGQINEARQAFSELIEKYPSSQYIPRARRMLQQL